MQRHVRLKGVFGFLAVNVMILLFVVSQGSAENAAGTEDLLVSKIVNAYGGRGLLSKVKGVSAEGSIKTYLSDDEGKYFRYMTRERKLVVDIRYSRTSEKRFLNGQFGYRETEGKTERAIGPPFDAIVYQYNQLNLPFGLIDGSLSVTGIKEDSFNGRKVTIVKLRDAYGYELEVHVDPEYYMIRRVIGRFRSGNHEASLAAALTDFRKVDGILMPFKIINYAGDTKLSETLISAYEINPSIAPTVFDP